MHELIQSIHLNNLQVVLSYIEDNNPDIESCQAAYEAYFGLPLQAATGTLQQDDALKCHFEAVQLREDICYALACNTSDALHELLHKYPAAQAVEALEDAVGIINKDLQQAGAIAGTNPAQPGLSLLSWCLAVHLT